MKPLRPTSIRTNRPSPASRGERRGARLAATVLLSTVGLFQAALVAGAPWGAAAWSGAHAGTLPTNLRIASLASGIVYVGLAVAVWSDRLSPLSRRRVLTGASGLMALGTLANLASPSMVEKLVWTPVAAALAVLLWQARPARPARPARAVAPGQGSRVGRSSAA